MVLQFVGEVMVYQVYDVLCFVFGSLGGWDEGVEYGFQFIVCVDFLVYVEFGEGFVDILGGYYCFD